MNIRYDNTLGTYVAIDNSGVVAAIYNPRVHGSVEEFRNAMGVAR